MYVLFTLVLKLQPTSLVMDSLSDPSPESLTMLPGVVGFQKPAVLPVVANPPHWENTPTIGLIPSPHWGVTPLPSGFATLFIPALTRYFVISAVMPLGKPSVKKTITFSAPGWLRFTNC